MPFATFTIIGTLGADPELKESGKGNAYARASVAVNRYDRNAGEEAVSWFWVTLFGAVAERFAEQAQKGSTVALLGEIQEDTGEHKGRHSFIVREFDVVRNWRDRKGASEGDRSGREEPRTDRGRGEPDGNRKSYRTGDGGGYEGGDGRQRGRGERSGGKR